MIKTTTTVTRTIVANNERGVEKTYKEGNDICFEYIDGCKYIGEISKINIDNTIELVKIVRLERMKRIKMADAKIPYSKMKNINDVDNGWY